MVERDEHTSCCHFKKVVVTLTPSLRNMDPHIIDRLHVVILEFYVGYIIFAVL